MFHVAFDVNDFLKSVTSADQFMQTTAAGAETLLSICADLKTGERLLVASDRPAVSVARGSDPESKKFWCDSVF